jgi:hypothetical protein
MTFSNANIHLVESMIYKIEGPEFHKRLIA